MRAQTLFIFFLFAAISTSFSHGEGLSPEEQRELVQTVRELKREVRELKQQRAGATRPSGLASQDFGGHTTDSARTQGSDPGIGGLPSSTAPSSSGVEKLLKDALEKLRVQKKQTEDALREIEKELQ